MDYISKTFRFDNQVMEWLEKLKSLHGSYNKGLRLIAFPGSGDERAKITETTAVSKSVVKRLKAQGAPLDPPPTEKVPDRVLPRFMKRKYE